MKMRVLLLLVAGASALPAHATLSIDTTNPIDWKIGNGAVSLDWNSQAGNVWSIMLAGHTDQLIDPTSLNGNGQPKGFYMDNAGVGAGATSTGYDLQPGRYLDWWITTASDATNPFTYSEHFVLADNDPGIHVYVVFNHAATDVAGTLGQVQYVFRVNPAIFTHTYAVNTGLNNLGVADIPLPDPTVLGNTDAGRQVQDATLDLHGLPLPEGFTREFYTKYDFAGYAYLQEANGDYGSTYGLWAVFPSMDSLVGGPTKQNLLFTDSIVMGELLSNHLDNDLGYSAPAGQVSSRLFGPIYYRVNTFNGLLRAPGALYLEALASILLVNPFYDNEQTLLANGYVPQSSRRTVEATVAGAGSSWSGAAVTVLGDNATNFQYTSKGHQYWTFNGPDGRSILTGVVPGTYRLSAYVIGQWGELRQDNVSVGATGPTAISRSFTPENFGVSPPVWTIGTPDRSAHEFLHGKNASGQDDKEFWGNWNYWLDFAANDGAVVYYATAVGSTPATNDLSKWNYVQWGNFDPGLFAGVYNPSDDTTDGYKYIVPAFVGNPSTAATPPWQVHFTTTIAQQSQGQYVVLSTGLAASEADVIATLNGSQLIWHGVKTKASDAMARSGLSGTYQWLVFQWNTSQLNPPGQDNVLTLAVNRSEGVMYDALRMEITDTSADPAVRGWNDYEYLFGSAFTPADDAVPNP
jgi:hypothetical protein